MKHSANVNHVHHVTHVNPGPPVFCESVNIGEFLKSGVKVSMCSCLFIVIIYLYIYYNYYIFIFLDQKNNTLRRDILYVHGFTNNGGPPVNMANMANMVNKWHEHGEHLW